MTAFAPLASVTPRMAAASSEVFTGLWIVNLYLMPSSSNFCLILSNVAGSSLSDSSVGFSSLACYFVSFYFTLDGFSGFAFLSTGAEIGSDYF